MPEKSKLPKNLPEFVDVYELSEETLERARTIMGILSQANQLIPQEATELGVTMRHNMLEPAQFSISETEYAIAAMFSNGLFTYYFDKVNNVPLAFWPTLSPFCVPRFDQEGNVYFIARDTEGSFADSIRNVNHIIHTSCQRESGKTGFVRYSLNRNYTLNERFFGERVGHHDSGTQYLLGNTRSVGDDLMGETTIPASHIARTEIRHERRLSKLGRVFTDETTILSPRRGFIEIVEHGYIPVGEDAQVIIKNGETIIKNSLTEWEGLSLSLEEIDFLDPDTHVTINYTDSSGRQIEIEIAFDIEGEFDRSQLRLVLFSPFSDSSSRERLEALFRQEIARLQELIGIYNYFGIPHPFQQFPPQEGLTPDIIDSVVSYLLSQRSLCIELATAPSGSEAHEMRKKSSCTIRKYIGADVLN